MKDRILVLALHFLTITVFAQTATVTGAIVDAADGTPIVGTHVVLLDDIAGQSRSVISDLEGIFVFNELEEGKYTLSVSFVGYQKKLIPIAVEATSIDLGAIKLEEGLILNEIEVVEREIRVTQKGDTTEFNAEGYSTLPDASAEDLIAKMPTLRVEEGKVQAMGEDVKQVLVDGKPFFGSDPTAALRNLPAEIIDKIQIFEKHSEQEQFSGFYNGESTKTINIVTKTSKRNGQFGKINAGYGSQDKYQGGGNINLFNGDQRLSIIGMSNNVNQQNFLTEDLLGVIGSSGDGRKGNRGGSGNRSGRGKGGSTSGVSVSDFLVPQQGGVTSANAFGINFSDTWGSRIDFSGSYFFNSSINTTEQLLYQQYFTTEGIDEIYNEESLMESTNTNHRFSGQLTYKIDERNSLIWQPKFIWQGNSGTETLFGQTALASSSLNQTNLDLSTDLSAYNLENNLLWRHKFNKSGRAISMNFNSGYAPKQGSHVLLSENIFSTTVVDTTLINQNSILDLNTWNMAANLQYTEPIGERSMLMFNYKSSYLQGESNKVTYDFDDDSQSYHLFNSSLSNIFSNDYITQQLGGGYSYRRGDLTIMTSADLQSVQLHNQTAVPLNEDYNYTFRSALPSIRFRYKISPTENFSLVYKASTQLPSIEQLHNVVDNSNPLQLTIGNPNLTPSYQHNLFTRYTSTNAERSSVFYALLRTSYTKSYIATSTYLTSANVVFPLLFVDEISSGTQLSQPINLDAHWSLHSFVTYGFPVDLIKSNLNVDFNTDYIRAPGLINEDLNYSHNSVVGLGLTLGSNFKDKIDFTLSSRGEYNVTSSTLEAGTDLAYYNQSTFLKFNYIANNGLVLRTDVTHQFYEGLSDDFDQNYVLWNLSIGKKVFKDQRGEISLSVFDILKQNNNLSRLVTEVYTEDIQTNVLQQYLMLSFKYDLRNFKMG